MDSHELSLFFIHSCIFTIFKFMITCYFYNQKKFIFKNDEGERGVLLHLKERTARNGSLDPL